MVAAVVAATLFGEQPVSSRFTGTLFDISVEISQPLSVFLNCVAIAGIYTIITLTNNAYRLIKSSTWYFVTLFFIALSPFAPLLSTLQPASLLGLTVVLTSALLFSTLARPKGTFSIYTIFLLLATAALAVEETLYFIPLFYVGMIQMRCINIKTVVASRLGRITPNWIMFGVDLASPAIPNIQLFEVGISEILKSMPLPQIAAAILTLTVGVAFLFTSISRSMAHSTARRARFGFLDLMLLNTLILIIIDAANISTYLTLYTLVWTFMAAHTFSVRTNSNHSIALIVIPVIFIAVSVWNYL